MSLSDQIMIAAPCSMSWDDMTGDDRVRHCGICQKNVYNISDMTSKEADGFLRENGSNECLRFFRRTDGTIIMDNCPVGLRKLRDRALRVKQIAATLISNFLAVTCAFAQDGSISTNNSKSGKKSVEAKSSVKNSLTKETDAVPYGGKPSSDLWNAPIKKGTTMLGADECSSSGSSKSNSEPPRVLSGRMAPMTPSNNSQSSISEHADVRAHSLYTQAMLVRKEGKLLVASSLLKDAIKAAKANPKTAPAFLTTIERAFESVQNELKSQSVPQAAN